MFKAIFLVALSTILPFSQLAAASTCKASRASPLQYVGVDWSSAIVEERDNGVVYKDAQGVVKPLETILVEAGVNMVRQRVFTVDEIPTGWPTDIDGLERTLWNYVTEVANTFYSERLWPETITIGNEIPNGILWPTGYFENPENLSRLLHTAAQAVRQSPLGSCTKILIHLAHGYNQELQTWFYDLVLAPGYLKLDDWDVSAVSFYPFWGEGATMQNLTDSLNHLATKYNKEVQVVETNWPTSCPNPDYAFPADQLDIPFTPAGQAQYLRLLADTLKAIPAATGLNYWEPAWINNAVLGSSCEANVFLAALGTLL
ncbi:glycoside hydrolase superfamily [Fusarium oxysporum]|nr:glycoside hydrolase superfamily [Fusarium oxysporum]